MAHAPYLRLLLLGLIVTIHYGQVSADIRRQDHRSLILPDGGLDAEEPPAEIPSQSESLVAQQFTVDPHAHRDRMEMIRNGELGLSGIRHGPKSFVGGADVYAGDVYGEFCAFDPSLSKKDPAKYPTIGAVMAESDHCGEHRYTIPLLEVVRAVSSSSGPMVKQLPVTGLLFHEGYSGAGLISNALTTFDSALVVSEHPAIRDALGACDVIRNRYKSEDCSPLAQRRLVRDVVSLVARTTDASAQHLYLKIPSASAAYLPELRSMYSEAKWAFVYRRAEDALTKHTTRKRNAVCLKARRNPSSALSAKSNEIALDLEQLSHHEVCALHLSTLLDAAISEHDKTGTGMLVSYDDDILSNADAIVNVILPYFGLGDEIESNPQTVRDNVAAVLSLRSNTSAKLRPEDKQWNVEGENVEVSDEVGAASKAFMGNSMESLKRARS